MLTTSVLAPAGRCQRRPRTSTWVASTHRYGRDRSHFRWLAAGRSSGRKEIWGPARELAQRLDDINRSHMERHQMIPLIVILVLKPELNSRRRHLPNRNLRIQVA